MTMRLLIVDHNALETPGQRIYEALAEAWPGTISLLVPSHWHDGYRLLRFSRETRSARLEVLPSRVLLARRTHRMIYIDLARVMGRFSPDLLFVNAEPENFQTWHAAWLAGRRTAMKFVFSTWRNIDHRTAGYPYRLQSLHLRAERAVLARADHGLAFTSAAVAIFGDHGFSSMTHVPPAVDTGVFFPADGTAERKTLGLSEFTIGFAGRLIREKGVDDLLRASALCRFPHQLLIVGDGPERGRLRTLARELGVSRRIVWTGAVPRAEVAAFINAMDVLVLPSRTGRFWKEQFGRILIEAMACRVPVVGSSSGAIPQVIGNAGVIVEEGNHHALAAAVTRLFDDGALREELTGRGLRRASGQHGLEAVASAYRELFISLVDSAQ